MSTTVTRRVPPQRLVTMFNPLIRMLAQSSLHGVVDDAVVVLHVVGRRTGRAYDIPVGFADLGTESVVLTQHRWRFNLRDLRELEVTHGGERSRRPVELVENPRRVAGLLARAVTRLGREDTQRRLGLAFPGGGVPGRADLEEAARRLGLAVVRIGAAGARSLP